MKQQPKTRRKEKAMNVKIIGIGGCGTWVLDADENGEYKVPEGVKRIGRAAFDVSEINTLILPSTVEEIYYNKEEDYQYDGLTIKAPVNSYAQTFAKKHGIPFEAIEE